MGAWVAGKAGPMRRGLGCRLGAGRATHAAAGWSRDCAPARRAIETHSYYPTRLPRAALLFWLGAGGAPCGSWETARPVTFTWRRSAFCGSLRQRWRAGAALAWLLGCLSACLAARLACQHAHVTLLSSAPALPPLLLLNACPASLVPSLCVATSLPARSRPFPDVINRQFSTHDPPIYPKCLQLVHGTRVCQLRVDEGRFMINHVMPLMLEHHPDFEQDLVLFNFGCAAMGQLAPAGSRATRPRAG
jgi:hypothetical protein